MNKRAVILLSGGIDSSTTLAIAKVGGFSCHALSFQYGQRHIHELEAAKKVAQSIGVDKHLILNIDLGAIGGSALTDQISVPKDRSESEMANNIPVTYVPARNTIFLSLALALSEVIDADDIFIGVSALDYSGYPDCRPEYIEAYETMANLATRKGVEGQTVHIHTPLIRMTKSQIILKGTELGLDYGLTLSCYDPDQNGHACGACDSCLLRKKGFREAEIMDPTVYQNQ